MNDNKNPFIFQPDSYVQKRKNLSNGRQICYREDRIALTLILPFSQQRDRSNPSAINGKQR